MGSFSWRSCATGRSIPQDIKCVLLLPDDSYIEGTYGDYGDIILENGDMIDVYVLYQMNYDIPKTIEICKNVETQYDNRADAINAQYAQADGRGCGFRWFRTDEFKKGMKYDEFRPSWDCREQGWTAINDMTVDERFEAEELLKKNNLVPARYYQLSEIKIWGSGSIEKYERHMGQVAKLFPAAK